jgi:hypothetical protein
MSNSLVNLRIDFAFKQLFGTNGNEDILVAFLNTILKDSLESPIVSLQLGVAPHRYQVKLMQSQFQARLFLFSKG